MRVALDVRSSRLGTHVHRGHAVLQVVGPPSGASKGVNARLCGCAVSATVSRSGCRAFVDFWRPTLEEDMHVTAKNHENTFSKLGFDACV